MPRSFGLVDDKVLEADFFLNQLAAAGLNFFAARCYFSAFVSSARTVTFALQASMTGIDGFDTWYAAQQSALRMNVLASPDYSPGMRRAPARSRQRASPG